MKKINILIISTLLFVVQLFAEQANYALKPVQAGLSKTDPLGVVQQFKSHALAKSNSHPDTLRVLAMRAEFVEDDLATTTGNGTFQYVDDGTYVINKPPHNRTYFQQQLKALNHYFETVSDGRLVIEGDVYPMGEQDAYQLDQNMVYYSGEEDEERKKLRWAELLRDVVTVAEAQDNPDFAAYDAFVVFHAGVGADISFDFDTSPYDIQSAFIDIQTLRETIGADDTGYQGIPAGDVFVQEGLIWPETLCQEEIDFGMTGLMTLLMGSQLGMPALYNTDTGAAGVGSWGMMDQGSFNYFGLMPAEPCAWTKIYMGWEDPIVVSNAQDVAIGSPDAESAPHLYKIPINSSEYFLLENRQGDRNGDGYAFGYDEQGKRIQFDSTKYNLALEDGLGVIIRIDEYDYGIPGSGILVWHIDENVIRENIDAQTINNNADFPGIDLVECDGPQDIGRTYGQFTAGSGTENGDYWDPFWASNFSHQYVNAGPDLLEELGVEIPISLREEELISAAVPVTLSPSSIPNSNAFGGAVSHITLFDFSEKDSVMTFSVNNSMNVAGFPVYVGNDIVRGGVMTVPEGVVVLRANGDLLAVKMDGSKLIDNNEKKTVSDYKGDTEYDYPLIAAHALTAGDSILPAPVALDIDDDGVTEIAFATSSGFYIYSLSDADADGRADLFYQDEGEFSSNIVAFGEQKKLCVGTQIPSFITYQWQSNVIEKYETELTTDVNDKLARFNNQISGYSTSGQHHLYSFISGDWQVESNLGGFSSGAKFASADFDADKNLDLILFNIFQNQGAVFVNYFQESQFATGSVSLVPGYDASDVSITDLDQDGFLELVFINADNLYAINEKAELSLNFPASLEGEIEPGEPFSPLAWQTDSKSYALAVLGETINLIDDKGQQVDGFPLSTGTKIITDPVMVQNAEGTRLYTVNADGFLSGWNFDFVGTMKNEWLAYGGNNLRGFQSDVLNSQYKPTGNEVMPKKGVFCWPNPVYDGFVHIRYTLNRDVDNVSVRIYDIAGELVTAGLAADTNAGSHDARMHVDALASGSYLARVEAQVGSESYVEFIKIAVVK